MERGIGIYNNSNYTLPQKKHNFNFQIFYDDTRVTRPGFFYDDTGPGSVTPGHVNQGKFHWPTLLPERKATSEKLRFF